MSTEYRTASGRADAEGNVYLIRGGEETYVGQYPGVSAEDAYAYFARKFGDLEAQVGLLEQRTLRGASASAITANIASIRKTIADTPAVGDFDKLESRLGAVEGKVTVLSEKQHEEARAAIDAAVAEREALVLRMEELAAADPASHQWKVVTPEITQLFDQWKAHQQTAPRLPKATADELWSRFRTARSHLEAERRKFFSHLDEQHKAARETKQRLIAEARTLSADDPSAIGDYRRLLDGWKAAGRAGGKVDDTLWDEFKSLGDALYSVKKEEVARENAEYTANLEAKLALLAEAEKLLPVTNPDAARKALVGIQTRWDEIGRVPRDEVRRVEDRIRKVERQVKAAEDARWKADNPETRERTNSMVTQLQESIQELEAQIAEATARGNAKKAAELTEAREARAQWLKAINH